MKKLSLLLCLSFTFQSYAMHKNYVMLYHYHNNTKKSAVDSSKPQTPPPSPPKNIRKKSRESTARIDNKHISTNESLMMVLIQGAIH